MFSPQVQAATNEVNDEPAPSRFSAVIEKIERLYVARVFYVNEFFLAYSSSMTCFFPISLRGLLVLCRLRVTIAVVMKARMIFPMMISMIQETLSLMIPSWLVSLSISHNFSSILVIGSLCYSNC